jgi:hypothetical protein
MKEATIRCSEQTVFNRRINTEPFPTRLERAPVGPRTSNAAVHLSGRAIVWHAPTVQRGRSYDPATLAFQQVAASYGPPLLRSIVAIGFVQPSWFV